jgi:hypothetical protein
MTPCSGVSDPAEFSHENVELCQKFPKKNIRRKLPVVLPRQNATNSNIVYILGESKTTRLILLDSLLQEIFI